MSLLLPDTGLLFWMTISFGIVFFILAKFAFPTILKGVDKRNSYINQSLEAAQEAEHKLATLNQQAEALMEKAKVEQKAIIDKAMEMKKQIEEKAREAAENEIRLMKGKAAAEIEESKRKVLEEVKEKIIDLSVVIAEKVVGSELASGSKQKELINRLLDEEIKYKS